MSSECSSYSCIDVGVNSCNTGTLLNITAPATETMLAKLEFNGVIREFGISTTAGEKIAILTSLLNECYVHVLRLYRADGSLHACYRLTTQPSYDVANAPVPTPGDNIWNWQTVTVASLTHTVASEYFEGSLSPIIWINGSQFAWAAMGVTHDPDTGTLDFTGYRQVKGSISFQYKLNA